MSTEGRYMEPLSIIAISGAVGGIAGKFAEKAWDAGQKWVSSYFKDHAPKAIEKANENSLDFLAQLAQRVKTLEEQGEQNKRLVEDSLNHPDFSVLLQKAIISSAQTDDKQKHELLARLVSDRLTKGSESLFALSSKLACDAVSMLDVRQIKILGLLTTLILVRPHPFPPPHIVKTNQIFNIWFIQWLTKRLHVYQDLTIKTMDLLHLESLSCVRVSIGSRELQKILSPSKESGLTFDYKAFSATEIGQKVNELWESELKYSLPTTIGQIIGIYASDMLTNTTTSFDGWGE
jgi:hypothetical protein